MKTFLKITAFSAFLLVLAGLMVSCNEEDNCIDGLGWSVRLKLNSQEHVDSLLENAEIQKISTRYDVEVHQSYPGAITPELLRYHTLTGRWCNERRRRSTINAFLATGKFENYVYEYGTARIGS